MLAVDYPSIIDSEKEHSDRSLFHYWGKSFIIGIIFVLKIPANAHTCLESIDLSRRMTLLPKGPCCWDNFLALFEYFVPTDKLKRS